MFDAAFFTALGQVIMIDLVLAGDNAVVIGLAAAGLPQELRVDEQSGVAVLAIVGSGMRGQKGVSAKLFKALALADGEQAVDGAHADVDEMVRKRMQHALDDLARRRRFPVIG